ncbi:MAG: DNA cytosine methyltransferase [Aestuariivita sp.]|nr:DNA cytosine methyltransferase [Aestuariivita sp.]
MSSESFSKPSFNLDSTFPKKLVEIKAHHYNQRCGHTYNLFREEQDADSVAPNWFNKLMLNLDVSPSPGWPDNFGLKLYSQFPNTANDIKTLALFSGAGGLDIGFHDAGFQIVECIEIEEDFAKTLEINSSRGKRFSNTKIFCGDIKDYNPKHEKIDFVIGGPPCQSFSAAGARVLGVRGINDDRGVLFKQYVRILKELQPKGFLFENVYRIVGAQGGKSWKIIQNSFKEIGYSLFWKILDSADYGVPQFRERLFIVGLREGSYDFPFPTHGPDSQDSSPYYSAGVAVKGLDVPDIIGPLSGRHGHLLNAIPPGLNYSYYTDRFGHPTPLFGWRSKFSDYLYKADPAKPVRTIKAQGGQYTGPFHWDNRKFTLDELKRLQTFPMEYVLYGGRQKAIHQLGNSVPPQLARILAMSIRDQVFGNLPSVKIDKLPPNYQLKFRARKAALTREYQAKALASISKIAVKGNIILDDISDKFYAKICDDLIFSVSKRPIKSAKLVRYDFKNNELFIFSGNAKREPALEIVVIPEEGLKNSRRINKIRLTTSTLSLQATTILWKSLEHLSRIFFYKDDLVQLFGYYQYRIKHAIQVYISQEAEENEAFWKLFGYITRGRCVGSPIHLEELAEILDIKRFALINFLKQLKISGYEIRSCNTNAQIEKDMVIIPYAFPSLNHRSLQRHTKL